MTRSNAGLVTIALATWVSCAPANDLVANKSVVDAYMEQVLNNGNFEVLDDLFPSEGFVLNGRTLTKQQIPAVRLAIVAAFPDFHVTIENQVAEGDVVVTRVTFTGTHAGEYRGIAPTGRRVRWTGMAMDHVVNGKVVEAWHEADDTGLLDQLRAPAIEAAERD